MQYSSKPLRTNTKRRITPHGFITEHWCYLGLHWYTSYGGNTTSYRNRECCATCMDRLRSKIAESGPKWPGTLGYRK